MEANLLALSVSNRELYLRLRSVTPSKRYTFIKSRSGETVPANPLPLHSTIDPKREASRLVQPADASFTVFLGLGGGFAPEAALQLTDTQTVIAVDFCIEDIACLFSAIDYTALLKNEKFFLLIDPSFAEIKKFIIENYNPSLCGGIRTIPLRTRTEQDKPKFEETAAAVQEAIETVGADYSVQAHFGKRWFSNIIRNIKQAEDCLEPFWQDKKNFSVPQAAIVAAGPSLDMQIPSLCECKSRNVFIICCDTALPVLLHNGIEPDAVVSIDCQHISYYHFFGCELRGIPLILDIASPPVITGFSSAPVFFSSSHPLAIYVSEAWRPFARLDTSGGNVTYACLSLAENLGAKHITLFGADFSYVRSQSYARGTYVYPFFTRKQNRLCPLEAGLSAFLYRSPFLPRENIYEKGEYFQTQQLRFYRKKLEEKASLMTAEVSCARGLGVPLNLQKMTGGAAAEVPPFPAARRAEKSAAVFLEQYSDSAASLPEAREGENYMKKLNAEQRRIFATLLPYAAAVKKREPSLKLKDLINETKRLCVDEIARVLARQENLPSESAP
jgi:hypothetical protein